MRVATLNLWARSPLGEIRQRRLAVTPRVNLSEFAGWIGMVEVLAPEPLLFVHHKPSFRLDHELERELQAVQAARLVEEVLADRDLHVVVAGDFDATPDSAGVRVDCRQLFDQPVDGVWAGDHFGVAMDLDVLR